MPAAHRPAIAARDRIARREPGGAPAADAGEIVAAVAPEVDVAGVDAEQARRYRTQHLHRFVDRTAALQQVAELAELCEVTRGAARFLE